MKLILEKLEYQKQTIASVVKVFEGQEKNTFENSFFFEIKSNVSSLTPEEIAANKQRVIADNRLEPAVCNLTDDNDYCICGTSFSAGCFFVCSNIFNLHGGTSTLLHAANLSVVSISSHSTHTRFWSSRSIRPTDSRVFTSSCTFA
jgi:type III restriction enzyme